MFLHDHAPAVLDEMANGLRLATVRCSCEYELELFALDVVVVRMWLAALTASGITLRFDYVRSNEGSDTRVATGAQQISCLRGTGRVAAPTPVPVVLKTALLPFGVGDR
jgi:enediyne biosynthesis thioesterase